MLIVSNLQSEIFQTALQNCKKDYFFLKEWVFDKLTNIIQKNVGPNLSIAKYVQF